MNVFYKPQHLKYDVKAVMRRFRVQVIALTMILLLAITAAVALADTDFGPGQTSGVAPQDANAKCHGDPKLFGPECK